VFYCLLHGVVDDSRKFVLFQGESHKFRSRSFDTILAVAFRGNSQSVGSGEVLRGQDSGMIGDILLHGVVDDRRNLYCSRGNLTNSGRGLLTQFSQLHFVGILKAWVVVRYFVGKILG